jgi:hypothetical protein
MESKRNSKIPDKVHSAEELEVQLLEPIVKARYGMTIHKENPEEFYAGCVGSGTSKAFLFVSRKIINLIHGKSISAYVDATFHYLPDWIRQLLVVQVKIMGKVSSIFNKLK